jgi:hypothetical protein
MENKSIPVPLIGTFEHGKEIDSGTLGAGWGRRDSRLTCAGAQCLRLDASANCKRLISFVAQLFCPYNPWQLTPVPLACIWGKGNFGAGVVMVRSWQDGRTGVWGAAEEPQPISIVYTSCNLKQSLLLLQLQFEQVLQTCSENQLTCFWRTSE